jgi:hypothetical protein
MGRRGLPVRLFDNNSGPQPDPRAATTHPATLDLLAADGLADDMARIGLVAPIFQFWDRPSAELVAQFDHAVLKNDTRHPFAVQCEQFKTTKLILDRLRKCPSVEVLFDHEVLDVTQTAAAVSVGAGRPARPRTPTPTLAAAAPYAAARASHSKASPGPSASSFLRRRTISKPNAAIATAVISPTPARGAIASRFPPMDRRGFGAPFIPPIRHRVKTRS